MLASEERIRDYMLCLTTFSLFEDTLPITMQLSFVDNYVRRVFNISLGLLIVYLSYPVVQNLLSSRQRMNTSFEPLRIVNTYGAFGRFATFVCTCTLPELWAMF